MPETADPKDIPESDRAYLPDGRWVEKQPDLVDEWQNAVRYDSCLIGFAEWSTRWDTDPMPEIHGAPEREPACNHLDMNSDNRVRVSSHIDLDEAIHSEQPFASAWVCDRSACVHDAMAYVTEMGKGGAFWTHAANNRVFTADAPTTERITQARLALTPNRELLGPEEAKARMNDEGYISVVVEVVTDDYLEAYTLGAVKADENNQKDLIHNRNFSFGLPTDCSTTIIGAHPGVLTVLYKTHIGSQLNNDDDDQET